MLSDTTQQDGLIQSRDLPIKLPAFEGPMDLLLFLIKRHEVDIYDIPIELITKQYLAVIRSMEKLELGLAGEFFVMASTLMYIKSRMLLPTNERVGDAEQLEEEDVDPRWELVQQLIEYKRFREAASLLREKINYQQDFLPLIRKLDLNEDAQQFLEKSDRLDLWNAFNLVMRRLSEKLVSGEIHGEQITVAERMEVLLEKLKTCPRFLFSELFEKQRYSISFIVATFLASLELTRLKKLTLQQELAFGDILCTAIPDSPLN